jgi:hypothetical protein
MIKEAKDVLEKAIRERFPEITICRSFAEESRAINARKFPLVALITSPGKFDDRKARTYRYYDDTAQTYKQRYVRGSRQVPIQVRVWGEGEENVDAIFSRIIPAIPRYWKLDDFEGLIVIEFEEHSDHADSMGKIYLSVAEVQFSVDVALEEEIVPTITTVEVEPEQASTL